MNSKDTVQAYFNVFSEKQGWENFVSENIVFQGPMPSVNGKRQWVKLTQQFIRGDTSSSLDSTVWENNKVGLTATYNLALPAGYTHSLKTIGNLYGK